MAFVKKEEKITKEQASQLVKATGIRHIAFIMDGNGRWAKKRGLPREAGHPKGAEAFKKVIRYCSDIGITIITVYAFSTENWSRPKKEVDAIMKLLDEYLRSAASTDDENHIRYYFLGDKSKLLPELAEKCTELEKLTEKNSLVLNVALNYGGRDEIVHAVNELIKEGKTEITEDDISSHIYTAHSPDPDLIVRSAGEMRLSNFLLWQCAYSEFYSTDTLWPDMTGDVVNDAIVDFSKRKRKYGGLSE